MDDHANRRRFPRVNVDERHTVRFQFQSRELVGLPMTNLSAGGCCVKVVPSQAEGLVKGVAVEGLFLVHPNIPSVPLRAMVCWLMGRQPGKTEGFALVGFEFTDITPQYQESLDAYVAELLK
jgi:c-di-GMP-binding flagellar brake protein YcgR